MLYRIKPLEWTQSCKTWWLTSGGWCASTVVGTFMVWEYEPGQVRWAIHEERGYFTCDSIEDGKAKAEAYYRERLLATLEPVPDGATVVAARTESEDTHDRPPGAKRP